MTKDAIVGTWDLVSYEMQPDGGEPTHPLGTDARGMLTYTPDGHMAVFLEALGRPPVPWRSPDVPAGDMAAAYHGFLSYCGTFEITGDSVIHHIRISSVPSWDDIDQVREFAVEGDNLVLSVVMNGRGTPTLNKLVWRRSLHDGAGATAGH